MIIDFIFSNLFKEISLTKILKNINKYKIVEINDSNFEYYKKHHFPNSISISKLNIEKINKFIHNKDYLIINAEKHESFKYYNIFKKMGYKKIYILNWKK